MNSNILPLFNCPTGDTSRIALQRLITSHKRSEPIPYVLSRLLLASFSSVLRWMAQLSQSQLILITTTCLNPFTPGLLPIPQSQVISFPFMSVRNFSSFCLNLHDVCALILLAFIMSRKNPTWKTLPELRGSRLRSSCATQPVILFTFFLFFCINHKTNVKQHSKKAGQFQKYAHGFHLAREKIIVSQVCVSFWRESNGLSCSIFMEARRTKRSRNVY